MACLALFWLTRWGRSAVECEAMNDARLQREISRNLQTQLDQVRRELARVVAVGEFGSANDPTAFHRPVSGLTMATRLATAAPMVAGSRLA